MSTPKAGYFFAEDAKKPVLLTLEAEKNINIQKGLIQSIRERHKSFAPKFFI